MVSIPQMGEYPDRVWGVTQNEQGDFFVLEAKYQEFNHKRQKIVYHGYPIMPCKDHFYRKVISYWRRRIQISNSI